VSNELKSMKKAKRKVCKEFAELHAIDMS
jgi:hypothetical protein